MRKRMRMRKKMRMRKHCSPQRRGRSETLELSSLPQYCVSM